MGGKVDVNGFISCASGALDLSPLSVRSMGVTVAAGGVCRRDEVVPQISQER